MDPMVSSKKGKSLGSWAMASGIGSPTQGRHSVCRAGARKVRWEHIWNIWKPWWAECKNVKEELLWDGFSGPLEWFTNMTNGHAYNTGIQGNSELLLQADIFRVCQPWQSAKFR
jgi:hypothetical protein